jgi:hypothetical protein
MGKRIGIMLLLLSGAGILLIPWQMIREGGLWPISVAVRSASNSPITAVSAEVFGSRESAEYTLEHLLPPEGRLFSAVVDPFQGEPFEVRVPTGQQTSRALLWAYTRHAQWRFLVVIARYKDGRREGRLVEIPDLRETRSLDVELP